MSKVLVFNNKPSEISFDLIFALKNRYEEKNLITKKAKLKKGDNVKFNSGPFVNLIAKIESVDDKNRIWLILEAMGRHRKLKIQEMEKNTSQVNKNVRKLPNVEKQSWRNQGEG